jgi:TPR repeat protein/uncharacterized membrane protein
MKNCPQCQNENLGGQKFCSKCGGILESELAGFLTDIGLSEHLALFEKNDLFTITELKALSEADISDLQSQCGTKIPFGDQIRLRKALALLSEGSASSRGGTRVVEKSKLEQLKEGALQGDLSAMFELGKIHSEGSEDAEKDLVEASAWFRKAAEKGHAAAQYNYGEALYYGRGVAEDERESAKWLRMATRQGHEEAKNNYNERLEEGRYAYLLDSSEQGNADSQYRLGMTYFSGEQDIPVDKSQAAVWFRKAAAQGLPDAQSFLGVMHLQGDGVRLDKIEGKRLLTAAASQGHSDASELLLSIEEVAPTSVHTPPDVDHEAVNKVGTVYLMMLLSIVTCGTTSIIGLIMAYMNRGKTVVPYLKTHYRWQIRSFWFYCLWTLVGSIASSIINPDKINEGAIVGTISFFWYYYRSFKGKSALKAGKPMYGAAPKSFKKPVWALIILLIIGAAADRAYLESEKESAEKDKASRQSSLQRQAEQQRQAKIAEQQNQARLQEESERTARMAREKAEAELRAQNAERAVSEQKRLAEQAEKEKQEALQRAQQAEQAASQLQSAAQSTVASGQQQQSSGQQLPDGFANFFKQYVRDHGSNNAWDLAYDYADPCHYSYSNGNASRAYIYDDIRKLVQAYPQRSYTDVGIDNITVLSPDTVSVRYHFNYQYSGKKLARGTSTVDLEVRNFSGKWQITNFSEQVIRR